MAGDLPVNHEEALELAYLKRNESNLARCYIELAERRATPAPAGGGEADIDTLTGPAIGKFQDDIRAVLIDEVQGLTGKDYAHRIDGGGCDSGDWRDFTLAEIRSAFRAIEHHNEVNPPAAKGGGGEVAPIVDRIRSIACEHGWAMGAHGSLVRDIDLIGAPWTDEACTAEALVSAILDGIGYHTFGHSLGRAARGGRRCILLFAPNAARLDPPHAKGTWSPPAIDLCLVDPRGASQPQKPAAGGEA